MAGLSTLRSALYDGDPLTRRHMAVLLEHLNYPVAREIVVAGLGADDVEVRLAAARVIGLNGDRRQVIALTDALKRETTPIVRAGVAWALGRMSGQEAVEPLLRLVQEEDVAVRTTAAEAIVRISNRLRESRRTTP